MLVYMILSFIGFRWIQGISCNVVLALKMAQWQTVMSKDIILQVPKKIQEFFDQLNDCHFLIKQNTPFYRIVLFS